MAKVAIILVIFPIALLIGIGALNANLTSSGFATTTATTTCTELQCPAYTTPGAASCSGSDCQLSGSTTYSFLNPNSPFTYLVQGDILGFVGSFTSNPSSNGPTSNFIQASPCTIVSGSGSTVYEFKCTSLSFGNPNNQFYANAPYTNFTSSSGNNSEWYCTDCLSVNGGTQIIPIQFYGSYNNVSLGGASCGANASTYCLFNLDSAQAKYYTGNSQSSSTTNCGGTSGTTCTTSTQSLSNTFSFFGFLIGILLLVMSLQLGGGASITILGSIRWSIGDQGARLAQAAGIGLLIYLPMYSEFGNWINDIGFGGSTILTVVLGAIFTFGIYRTIMSYF